MRVYCEIIPGLDSEDYRIRVNPSNKRGPCFWVSAIRKTLFYSYEVKLTRDRNKARVYPGFIEEEYEVEFLDLYLRYPKGKCVIWEIIE